MIINSLFNALSGLRTSSKKLQTSANNLANLQTPGFKKSRAEVGEVASGGAQVSAISQNSSAGSLIPSSNMPKGSNVDIVEEIVGQIVAKASFKANASVIRTSKDLLGTLLDIKS